MRVTFTTEQQELLEQLIHKTSKQTAAQRAKENKLLREGLMSVQQRIRNIAVDLRPGESSVDEFAVSELWKLSAAIDDILSEG
jgi:hypothetical protein